MLSGIGRIIRDHREGVGMALVGIGFFWLMGVAGADDFNTMQHVFTPVIPLIMKSVFGLLIVGLGVRVLNGGDPDENSL